MYVNRPRLMGAQWKILVSDVNDHKGAASAEEDGQHRCQPGPFSSHPYPCPVGTMNKVRTAVG